MTGPVGATPGRARALRRQTFAALAEPNFRRYFVGLSVSFFGTWMALVALGWLMLELTGSATWVGLAIAAQTVPMLVIGPYGGLVADRVDKRRLLVLLQLAMAAVASALAVVTLTGVVQPGHVLVLAMLLGVADAFEKPARQSFLIEVVGEQRVRNAVSLNAVMVNASRTVGPAIGGVIIAGAGTGWCFAINAVTFLPMALILAGMDARELHPSPPQPRGRGQLRAGLVYVRGRRELAVPLLMMTIMGCLTFEFPVSLPALARSAFDGDSRTYGFMTAAMGLGAVAGGLHTAARGRTGIPTMVRSALVLGVLVLAAALAPTVAVALVLLVGVGAASVSFMARGNATIQLEADPGMRGRVMSLWLVAFIGTTPIGGPAVGWVAATFGARWGLILGAAGCFAAVAVALWPGSLPKAVRGDGDGPAVRAK